MADDHGKQVAIIQRNIPHYRVAFFERLRAYLRRHGVELRLFYGPAATVTDDDPALFRDLDWAEPYRVVNLTREITWQPVLLRALSADLVIVEAKTGQLINYLLQLAARLGRFKFAFWGHGWGHQSARPDGPSERIKLWLARRADWYFAYTGKVREGLITRGCKGERITDTQNAVERPPEIADRAEARRRVAAELDLPAAGKIAFYCGSLTAGKNLDLLLDAAALAQRREPGLALVIAGEGAERPKVEAAAKTHPFIRFVGPVFDRRKSEFLAAARMVVMPGTVGLGVLDAFHGMAPPIATTVPFHGPEFSYIRDDRNGLIVVPEAATLAEAMVRLAADDELHARLVAGCREASERITIDEMARRFGDGILAALEVAPQPASPQSPSRDLPEKAVSS